MPTRIALAVQAATSYSAVHRPILSDQVHARLPAYAGQTPSVVVVVLAIPGASRRGATRYDPIT